jgi:membrane-bound lytic murein transglycosylase MltF
MSRAMRSWTRMPSPRLVLVLGALTVALAGCAQPAPPPAPAGNATPAAPAPEPAPLPDPSPEPAPSKADLGAWSRPALGDLDAILARGTLRILVPISRTSYYVEGALQHGATFAAGKHFEAFLKAQAATPIAVVFVPTRSEDLVAALNEGRGDIAANLVVSPDQNPPLAATVSAVTGVSEVVVTGPQVPKLVSLEDLEGRTIHVRRSSRHFADLARLNARLIEIGKRGCTIVAASESLEDEDLLELVSNGKIPATVVDSHIAALWKPVLGGISVNEDIAVSQDTVIAWAVRSDAPQLLARVQAFKARYGAGALFGHAAPVRKP